MMLLFSTIVVSLILIAHKTASGTICQCSYSGNPDVRADRKLSQQSHTTKQRIRHRKVEFRSANIRGEDYLRPLGASKSIDLSYDQYQHQKQLQYDSYAWGESFEASSGDCVAEQVHITLGNSIDSMIVSFTSSSSDTSPTIMYSSSESSLQESLSAGSGASNAVNSVTGSKQSYSQLMYIVDYLIDPAMGAPTTTAQYVLSLQNTSSWAKDPVTGEHYANYYNYTTVQYGLADYNNPYVVYDSPVVLQAELTGLKSGMQYFYAVNGSCDIYQFTMPYFGSCNDVAESTSSNSDHGEEDGYPFMVGLTADIGQTNVSVASMEALAALEPAVILLAGDLSYADGWPARWDSFARTIEFLASSVPVLTTGGNHEISDAEAWLSYTRRWPTPSALSHSTNFCYWGREVGRMHVIALCSYAGYSNSSLQYQWLSNYLETSINRSCTPWIVVMMHTPWYNTNVDHWKEAELMRNSMEPLLYSAGVDIVLNGHVHSYERTHPVYLEDVNDCGPTYLNLGDGGNREGTYTTWKTAPSWTAFREASFGVGQLQLMNSSHAYFAWHRHACGSDEPGAQGMNFSDNCVTPGDNSAQAMLTSDSTWFVRPSIESCPNRYVSTKSSTSSTSNDDDDNSGSSKNDGGNKDNDDGGSDLSDLNIALIVLCVMLFVANAIQLMYWTNNFSVFAPAAAAGGAQNWNEDNQATRSAMHSTATEMTDMSAVA